MAEATKQFSAYTSGNHPTISPNLRLSILRIGVQYGGPAAYEAIKKEYLAANSGELREICLTAMARVQSADLVEDFLDFQFSSAVALQDTHTGVMWLSQNVKARPTLWQWMKSHWQTIVGKLGAENVVLMDRFVRVSLASFSTRDMETELEEFFAGMNTKAFERAVAQVKDSVRRNANYRERDEALVLEWLDANGYA